MFWPNTDSIEKNMNKIFTQVQNKPDLDRCLTEDFDNSLEEI